MLSIAALHNMAHVDFCMHTAVTTSSHRHFHYLQILLGQFYLVSPPVIQEINQLWLWLWPLTGLVQNLQPRPYSSPR